MKFLELTFSPILTEAFEHQEHLNGHHITLRACTIDSSSPHKHFTIGLPAFAVRFIFIVEF